MLVHDVVDVCSLCFDVTLSLLLMVLFVDVCSIATSCCCLFMSLCYVVVVAYCV